MPRKVKDPAKALARAAEEQARAQYVLKLYVSGISSKSEAAIRMVTETCEKYLAGRYELEVIDIYQNPALAKGDQIIAAPTLIRKLPQPLRRLIGNMASEEKLLVGLDLRRKDGSRE